MKNNSNKLRNLCINKKWFTCGDNTEYEILLTLADTGASLEDLARRIYINSDDFNYNVILQDLKEHFNT